MLHSPMLFDQNMICGSNTDHRDHFPRIQLVVYQICIPTFPFDPPTQSDTLLLCNTFIPRIQGIFFLKKYL